MEQRHANNLLLQNIPTPVSYDRNDKGLALDDVSSTMGGTWGVSRLDVVWDHEKKACSKREQRLDLVKIASAECYAQ